MEPGTLPTAAVAAFAEALFPAMTSLAAASRRSGMEEQAVFYETKGNCSGLVLTQVIVVLQEKLPAHLGSKLIQFLHALESRFSSLLLCGTAALAWEYPYVLSFVEMSVERRNTVFSKWIDSRITPLTAAFRALKSIIGGMLFGNVMESGNNPLWAAMGYPSLSSRKSTLKPNQVGISNEDIVHKGCISLMDLPLGEDGQARILDVLLSKGVEASIEESILTLTCNAVVVGSGAGGGVSAAILSQAGFKVLVVEKSMFHPASSLSLVESEAFGAMYERGTYLTTSDGGIQILAGSTVGGGTRINWGASLRTPQHVLTEWSSPPHSIPEFGESGEYAASMDKVCSRLQVHEEMNQSNHAQTVIRGLKDIDIETPVMPSNCLSRTCSGFCCYGCPYAEKQDGIQTYLLDAVKTGARIITSCCADRIVTTKTQDGSRKKQVSAIQCTLRLRGGETYTVLIKSDIVVCAGGSINSPALLLRSGIRCNGNVGRNLRLHPAMGVVGAFPEGPDGQGSTQVWEGSMMDFYSKDLANWDGSGPHYGPLLSVPPFHPGQAAAACPWYSALEYKNILLGLKNSAVIIVYTRDQDAGRVAIDGNGNPVVSYWPSKRDRKQMIRGVVASLKGLKAAGARLVLTSNLSRRGGIKVSEECGEFGDEEFDNYIRGIEKTGVLNGRSAVFSAHQMGSCRMGASPKTSVADRNGETWEVKGLFICDASAFPSASGVNPMITTLSVAHMNTQKILDRMKKAPHREHLSIDCTGPADPI